MEASTQLLLWLAQYKYAVMFPLAVIEGPIVTVICGFLLSQGRVEFLPTYLALMGGDLFGDCIWYVIGRFAARPFINRYGHFIGFTTARVTALEQIFKKHQAKTLLISKLTTGFGFAPLTLMTAGSVGILFRTYIALNALGQLIWTGMLLVIGVFFGQFYVTIDAQLRTGYIVAMVLVVVIALYLLQRHMRKKLTEKTT